MANCGESPTKAVLERAHGTPAEFAKAVRNAWDMITPQEAEAAIRKYEREYFDAPEGK